LVIDNFCSFNDPLPYQDLSVMHISR